MGLLLKKMNESWVLSVREKWKIPKADWETVREKFLRLLPAPPAHIEGGMVLLTFAGSEAIGEFKDILTLFNDLAVLKEKYGSLPNFKPKTIGGGL